MKLFHGTTADAAIKILRDGFKTEEGGANWYVSGEAIYFWSPKELVEKGETEEEYAEDEALRHAKESGEFGLGQAIDCRTVVFEVELDEKTFEVLPDESCENMGGAVCVYDDVAVSAIRKIYISKDLSLLKGYYLAFLLDRDLCNRSLSHHEKLIAEAFSKIELYPDDMGITELSEISFAEAEKTLTYRENALQ